MVLGIIPSHAQIHHLQLILFLFVLLFCCYCFCCCCCCFFWTIQSWPLLHKLKLQLLLAVYLFDHDTENNQFQGILLCQLNVQYSLIQEKFLWRVFLFYCLVYRFPGRVSNWKKKNAQNSTQQHRMSFHSVFLNNIVKVSETKTIAHNTNVMCIIQ